MVHTCTATCSASVTDLIRDTGLFPLRKADEEAMKTTRKLSTYVGPFWLMLMSHTALAQTAPNAPLAPPAAGNPSTAPAAAPGAEVQPNPAAPAVAQAPATSAAPQGAANTPAALDSNAAQAPVPVAVPPAPTPAIEPAPVASPPAAPAEPATEVMPKKIAIGNSGWLKIGGLAQGWFVVEDGTNIAANPAGGSFDTTAYFRVRRAYFNMSGEVVKDRVGFRVELDAAKTFKYNAITANGTTTGYTPPSDTGILLDGYVTVKSDYADVSIGQWKSPISYEAISSSSEQLLPERAHTTRYFGDNFDAGVRVDKKFELFKYSLQLLQGAPGGNQIDKNRQKEVALRLEFTPMKGIMVGGAGLTSVGQRTTQDTTRDVVEADVAFEHSDFIARGELLWQWRGVTKEGATRVKSRGMAATLAYTIAKKVQPVVRMSYLDVDQNLTNTAAANQPLYAKFGLGTDEIRAYEFGINYLIDGKYAKIQASYSYFDMDTIPYRQQFILAGQAAF